jgi:hypothetical protein
MNIFCQESLGMITFSEIQTGDLIKVSVIVDDVEDELYARVVDNRLDYLEVNYYVDTSLVYKGARVYALESEVNILRAESICEHWPDGQSVFEHVSEERYVLKSEVDSGDESTFYDESDDSGSDLRDFVVSDEECELPPDHRDIDKSWNEWQPNSEGSKKFKKTIDDIEARVRVQMDNVQF